MQAFAAVGAGFLTFHRCRLVAIFRSLIESGAGSRERNSALLGSLKARYYG